MKNEKKIELKVGITIVVSLIIFISILAWAKNFSFTDNYKVVKIKFDSVAGLQIGDPVSFNGLKCGYVDNIYLNKNSVIVDALIKKNLVLTSDAEFSILMLDLMGGKKIEIKQGVSNEKLNFNKTQNGKFSGDISTAMAMLSSVQFDLVDLIKELKISLKNVNAIFDDEELKIGITNSIKNINLTSEKINQFITENRNSIKNILSNGSLLISNGNEILEANKNNITGFFKNSNKLILSADSLIHFSNGFLKEIKDKKNNIGTVIYDKKIINNLKQSSEDLKKLLQLIRNQLENKGLKVDAYIF